jgi:hypothetical protein
MRATGRRRSRPLIEEALSASREAKAVDFKAEFDPSDRRSLCETLKDVLAMANSGGGVIVVGVDGQGRPTGGDVRRLLDTDPADLANKMAAFTGRDFDGLAVRSHAKGGKLVATVEVRPAPTPLVPVRPGTYEREPGRQATAFSVGVVYVRHGAKSEPATSHDLERIIERRLREVRSFWLGGVRRVSEAPPDSVVTVSPRAVQVVPDSAAAAPVRVTTDPAAPLVALADPDQTHPHRLMELLSVVNAKLKALGVRLNTHDVKAVLAVQGWEADRAYTWKPRHGSRKYSDALIEWLVKEVSKDGGYLRRTRAKWKRMPRPG